MWKALDSIPSTIKKNQIGNIQQQAQLKTQNSWSEVTTDITKGLLHKVCPKAQWHSITRQLARNTDVQAPSQNFWTRKYTSQDPQGHSCTPHAEKHGQDVVPSNDQHQWWFREERHHLPLTSSIYQLQRECSQSKPPILRCQSCVTQRNGRGERCPFTDLGSNIQLKL